MFLKMIETGEAVAFSQPESMRVWSSPESEGVKHGGTDLTAESLQNRVHALKISVISQFPLFEVSQN
jgi:hypothetical protein